MMSADVLEQTTLRERSGGLGGTNFLVTGAHGFIGAWVTKRLLAAGARVVIFDRDADPRRLRLIMDDEEVARAIVVTGDITEAGALPPLIEAFEVGHVIHLAGLQVPTCRADPRAEISPIGVIEPRWLAAFSRKQRNVGIVEDPARRRAGQRRRHDQRLRSGAPLGRAGEKGRLRQLGRRLRDCP